MTRRGKRMMTALRISDTFGRPSLRARESQRVVHQGRPQQTLKRIIQLG